MNLPFSACKVPRRRFLATTAALWPAWHVLVKKAAAAAPPLAMDGSGNVFLAPNAPAQWPAFRTALAEWRAETRARLSYSDALYRRPDFAWSAKNYACGFLMMCDQAFYDSRAGRYTVAAFLDKAEREFGGYDSVVLWHAYPRIGLDPRNQFDFYRDMPGGLRGVRSAVRQFHQRGVRVYVDYNPWDTGTRPEPVSALDALAELVRSIEADGIFLDTLSRGAGEFRTRLDNARPGVILEGESAAPLECIHDHHASWAQWFDDSEAPGILKQKWFERRHMQHQIRRWDRDHSAELHAAWMNGSGMMIWENVFGSFVRWNPRDRSIMRQMLPVQRRYTALFQGERWQPLVPAEHLGVFASLWEHDQLRLWTVVNRAAQPVVGAILRVPAMAGHKYFDLIQGNTATIQTEPGQMLLCGNIPARGIACFLSGPATSLGDDFSAFLKAQARRNAQFNPSNIAEGQATRRIFRRPQSARSKTLPIGMVEVPAATMDLVIDMRVRECGFYQSVLPEGRELGDCYNFRVEHFARHVSLSRFAIDETPVTNAQFAEFLRRSRYRPKHRENFVKHWSDGNPPPGTGDHPVVYVDLEDARAYAAWAGKRLPTEEEWQYAAQGADARVYPWGNQLEADRCNRGESGGTTPVKAFPRGRSPFGCYDMCGNVWHWTESEYDDSHTRFCILRGGAWYSAPGSGWYMDGGPRPVSFAAKFLQIWPGLDRCSTVGFRCAVTLGAPV